MALDAYSPCPCGSGKKFKWCCQPIHAEIDHAFKQDSEGQHEAALKIMHQVVTANPANPEAFGRQAQLLYQNDRAEEAEAAIQKAFEINPNYAFGHLLRGMFRLYEGEFAGALLLFRKAADLYDPLAVDQLAQVYSMIADCEMRLGRPVAVRAALQIALRCQPGQNELREQFDSAFGDKGMMPNCARQEYALMGPPGSRSNVWQKALSAGSSTRLGDLAKAFDQLTKLLGEPTPANVGEVVAAWYNLALTRAWLGDNKAALAALDRYLELEPDDIKAGEAAALGEVLRMGQGMEEESDYREFAVTYQVRDVQIIGRLLEQWDKEQRLLGTQVSQEQGIISTLVMEKLPVLAAGSRPPMKLLAYFLLAGGELRLSHPLKESVEKVRADLEKAAASGLSPAMERMSRGNFRDVTLEALVFPVGVSDKALAEAKIRENASRFYEETWIQRPLRSLNQIAPVDAIGHRVLKRKLVGVIQFLQDCAAKGALAVYDFDKLRRRLGLLGDAKSAGGTDIGAMGAAELAGLALDTLSEAQLEEAWQSAMKVDAQELAQKFAKAVVAKPQSEPGRDRGPSYFYLIQRALAEGQTDEALDLVNGGERYDCENNEGKRQSDFELRRAQVLVKRREADQAFEVFERMLQRNPDNQKVRGTATESMLTLKQPARALKLAEEGLAKARQKGDRDSEGYFQELLAAAKKG